MKTWKTIKIGDFLEFKNGLNKGKEFFGVGTPIVNYMDVYKKRRIRIGELKGRVTLSKDEVKRFKVQKGDVFFTRTSETPEEVGYPSVMLDDVDDCVFSGFVLRGRPKNDLLDINYCMYAFFTPEIRKAIMTGCTYTTRALTNGKQLSDIEMPLPEKDEQHTIATALSDMDGYITALEKLITKKRFIRQGAMQELLTGKRRLPGFNGEWMEHTVEEISEAFAGGTPSTFEKTYWNGDIVWLQSGRCQNNVIKKQNNETCITARGLAESAAKLIKPNSVLVAITGATCGNIAFLPFAASANQSVVAIEPNDETENKFLFYLMITKRDTILMLQTGSAQGGTNLKSIKGISLLIPDKTEQTAIAEILSDMDAEIDALTAKLNKAKQIKQGMMNELLTGKIRLTDIETDGATEKSCSKAKTKPTHKEEEQTVAKGHNQQFDDAVMIAGIVNVLYHEKYLLGRKKVQKCLYLLRRHKNENTEAFKKKAAGPYADEVRYKGGEPIAKKSGYINTTTSKQGTTFSRGKNISQALGYIEAWGRQDDIQLVADNLRFKKVDELELLATVDMASCDLKNNGIPITVQSIKHLIETNKEWKAKLEKQIFSDTNIDRAIKELQTLLKGGN